MRRAALTGFALLAACSFNDPNAPPPKDPCIVGGPGVQGQFWARIDGPAPCSPIVTDPDTISHFTGSGWNEQSALCRAKDLFLGATPVVNADILQIESNQKIPPNAFGYCIVNKGTASEVVSYSVCGQAEAGKGACENTLPQQASIEVTAEWVGCPGGPLCPMPSEEEKNDVCAGVGEGDPANSFAVWLDVPDLFCVAPEVPEMPDAGATDAGMTEAPPPVATLADKRDSLFVSLGTGYNRQGAQCTASSVFDLSGSYQLSVEAPERQTAPERSPNGVRTGAPTNYDKEASPAGAKGYCLYGSTESSREAALFSFCDIVVNHEGADAALYSPESLCEKGFPRVSKPRIGTWYECPGSALCVEAEPASD